MVSLCIGCCGAANFDTVVLIGVTGAGLQRYLSRAQQSMSSVHSFRRERTYELYTPVLNLL